jgi:hypothetical protein
MATCLGTSMGGKRLGRLSHHGSPVATVATLGATPTWQTGKTPWDDRGRQTPCSPWSSQSPRHNVGGERLGRHVRHGHHGRSARRDAYPGRQARRLTWEANALVTIVTTAAQWSQSPRLPGRQARRLTLEADALDTTVAPLGAAPTKADR